MEVKLLKSSSSGRPRECKRLAAEATVKGKRAGAKSWICLAVRAGSPRSVLGVVGAFFPLSFSHSPWASKDVQAVGAATRTVRLPDSFLQRSPPLALLRAAANS